MKTLIIGEIINNNLSSGTLEILSKAKQKGVTVHLPIDVLAGKSFSNNTDKKVFDLMNILDGWEAMDAGPKSEKKFHDLIMSCKTILWNGPMGVFEFSNFSSGTKLVGKAVANSTKNG